MSTPSRGVGFLIALVLVALPAAASWQAAELIYIPAVAETEGAGDSEWRTDLYITNMDDVDIDVAMVYLPSGLVDNGFRFSDRSTWLGPREDQGFGWVNEELADIPPSGTVVLRDVVGEYWLEESGTNGLGAMIIFAYEAGTLEDDGSRVDAIAVANARVFNDTIVWLPDPDGHGFISRDASFGQIMPGVAWYNLADPAAVTEEVDYSYMVLVAGEQNPEYRFNLGVLNGSDPQTTITIAIQPFQPNGEPYLDEDGDELISFQVVPPLAHLQFFRIFNAAWGLELVEPSMVKVSFVAWTSNNPDPVPAFVTYGSLINDALGDPNTIMGSFAMPYDVECVWPNAGESAGTIPPSQRRAKYPVEFPPR